jgi:hypothetical protein
MLEEVAGEAVRLEGVIDGFACPLPPAVVSVRK